MIKNFAHVGLKNFFLTGSKKGIQPHHAERIGRQLGALNHAVKPEDMDVPAWRLHLLRGKLKGHWSVTVNGNWRITFKFEGSDVHIVNYQDYH
jgi:proteic killer suppression protein